MPGVMLELAQRARRRPRDRRRTHDLDQRGLVLGQIDDDRSVAWFEETADGVASFEYEVWGDVHAQERARGKPWRCVDGALQRCEFEVGAETEGGGLGKPNLGTGPVAEARERL